MATIDTFIEPIVIQLATDKYLVGTATMGCFYKNNNLHFHFSLN